MAAVQQGVVAGVREADAQVAQRLVAALEGHGVTVVSPEQARGTRSVVVWSLPADDGGFQVVRRAHPQLRVLVLVDDPQPEVVSSFLGAGAQAVVDRSGHPDTIAGAAVAVARGYLVLPSGGRQALLPTHLVGQLTEERLGWMQGLADGLDVATVADQAGCSEREMYRRLRCVYELLQVPGRTEALRLLSRASVLGGAGSIRR